MRRTRTFFDRLTNRDIPSIECQSVEQLSVSASRLQKRYNSVTSGLLSLGVASGGSALWEVIEGTIDIRESLPYTAGGLVVALVGVVVSGETTGRRANEYAQAHYESQLQVEKLASQQKRQEYVEQMLAGIPCSAGNSIG